MINILYLEDMEGDAGRCGGMGVGWWWCVLGVGGRVGCTAQLHIATVHLEMCALLKCTIIIMDL